ncbi:polar amino acid ABC transporter ATP-binding protein [Tyzzerella sp. An114]|uniref:amino acid ABC transporter ATP-binding protein n=1 Tax=Tyzzerella sp. An114 TaxID=1965545 RepID=UPI000B4552AD|nr:amino acid ABC transporter ATP-binding protein [Tyzzerella sp. An114]OUQ59057.1 polar amino acid ABC transporter ATP-binding protein [Tyzzerella sp. An114]HIT72087.1 amino acid ABC transporter ATP-binding protein [Candidatus Fimicola cottocaccae]
MLLKADGLCKSFGGKDVLKGVSLEANPGEIISIIGKSGAGKTTVLRCIMGLETCDKGTILIDGKYLCMEENGTMVRATKKELYEIRKSLGMVFQNYHLFPHLTVLENVTLALTEVYKMSKEEADKKAIKILERLDMGDKLNNKPFELSGGQKQRVAIARSCVTNPKLLCFDEPTAALDSALVMDIVKIIRDLAKDGMGILIISHDEKFVRDVSDRIVVIENGVITADMNSEEYSKIMRA